MVQDGTLTTLESVAASAKEQFQKYYDAFMSYHKAILVHATNKSNSVVCVKSVECISLVRMAVEMDTFRNEAKHACISHVLLVYEVLSLHILNCAPTKTCTYIYMYVDGSTSSRYIVNDVVQYDRVPGDFQPKSANGSIIFGCSMKESGDLESSNGEALDGILTFGNSTTSMLSQLISFGTVKKMFAHCLYGTSGSDIFAIGTVVEPKVNMTPLIPNQSHYNVIVTAFKIGREFLNLLIILSGAGKIKSAIIDSGLWCIGWQNSDLQAKLLKRVNNKRSSEVYVFDHADLPSRALKNTTLDFGGFAAACSTMFQRFEFEVEFFPTGEG